MIHKGQVIAQGRIEDLKAIDREIEISVWGGASKIEEKLKDMGQSVRRTGRVMRITRVDDSTYALIIKAAAETGSTPEQIHLIIPYYFTAKLSAGRTRCCI